jgi:F0F1-type ATP synthase delta subunit
MASSDYLIIAWSDKFSARDQFNAIQKTVQQKAVMLTKLQVVVYNCKIDLIEQIQNKFFKTKVKYSE